MFLNSVRDLSNIVFTIKNGECIDKKGSVLILNENGEKVTESGFSLLINDITKSIIVTLTSQEEIPTGNYTIDLNKMFKTNGKIYTDLISFDYVNTNPAVQESKVEEVSTVIPEPVVSSKLRSIEESVTISPDITEEPKEEASPVVYSSLSNISVEDYTPITTNINVNTSVSTGTGTNTTGNTTTVPNANAELDVNECYPIHKVYTSDTNVVDVEFTSRVIEYNTEKMIITDKQGKITDFTVKFQSENVLRFTFTTDVVDKFITILLGLDAINGNNNIYKFSVQINARNDYFTSYAIMAMEYHSLPISPAIELVMWYILNRIDTETEFHKLSLASIDKAMNCVITSYNTPFVKGLDKMNNKVSTGTSTLTDAYLSSATIGPLSAAWDRKILTSSVSTGGLKKDFGEENFNECFLFLKLDDIGDALVKAEVATINEPLSDNIDRRQTRVVVQKESEQLRTTGRLYYRQRSGRFY